MRRRNHDAQISPQRAGHHGDAGRRQRPKQAHIHTHRSKSGHKRWLDHIARKPRVFADNNRVLAAIFARKILTRRHAKAHYILRLHRAVIGQPAYAVSPEIFFRHDLPLKSSLVLLQQTASFLDGKSAHTA